MTARFAAATCAIAAVAVSLLVLGLDHTLVVLAVLAGIAAVTAVGTELILRSRRHGSAGPLPRQLSLMIALVIVPLLVALGVLGLLMFVSSKDAALVGVIVALTGLIGVLAARRLSSSIEAEVAELRDGLVAVGSGARDVELRADSAAELRELAAAANLMIASLRTEEAARDQSDAARRHLVAAASHDLRTPITSLRLLAQAIDDELVVGQTRREYSAQMLIHIEALSALIDDLFELSRLEAGDINWTLERVALAELVNDSVEAMRVQGEVKGVSVTAVMPEHAMVTRCNPEKLQRVLFNLIQNAIRHSPADGSVVVRAETLLDAVEVEVADTGEGIPLHERDFVFDAFFRGDESRTTDGAGLGLAVSRAIVEAHGGRIWLADPDTAVGTRVRFSVPLAA